MSLWTRSLRSVFALAAMACSSPATPPAPLAPEAQLVATFDAAPATPEVPATEAAVLAPLGEPEVQPFAPPPDLPNHDNPFVDFDKVSTVGGLEPIGDGPALEPRPEPKLTIGVPRVDGTLDQRQTAMLIRRYSPGLEWCYVDRQKTVPTLAGEVTLQFEVLADGTTKAPRVSRRTLEDAQLEACFLSKIPRWRFTMDGAGVGAGQVTLTFGMQPPEAPAK